MVKYRWELDPIENMVIVTRIVDSGEEGEDQHPILKLSRVARDNAIDGLNEIRVSLDLLEKELRADQAEQDMVLEKPKEKTAAHG